MLLDQLHHLEMPTLVVWGIEDKIIPYWHANAAAARLQNGSLKLIPAVVTCRMSSNPSGSYRSSASFLGACGN